MKKDTSKLLEELQSSGSFKKYYEENREEFFAGTLSELLNSLIADKGLKKADVIKESGMSQTYAYQIFNGLRVPERNKLICLGAAMGLTLEEMQKLLKLGGYSPLYVKLPFDCIVVYGICNKKSVMEINYLLYDYGFETLG